MQTSHVSNWLMFPPLKLLSKLHRIFRSSVLNLFSLDQTIGHIHIVLMTEGKGLTAKSDTR